MMIFLFRIVFNVFAFVGTIADSKQIFNSSVLSWNALQYVRGARKVLNIVEGCAQSGRVLGVIGPSGCGKTTLLRVIALRSMATHGKITWMKGSSPMVLRRADISFVHQDDSFFSMLTVRETINLAAQFRRYKYRATFDTDYLNELLFYVGLESIANSKVGSVKGNSESDVSRGERQSSSSGISGGERKRLALACELVGRPAILLADEPTSGLDAFQAQQVMQLFHEQSRTENCIVICAIHQPRSSIWGIFDDIMLLTPDGRTAYHGSRAAAAGYFQNIGYSFPEATNPAEFLIDLVSHDTSSRNAMQNSLQRIEELVMAYENRNRTTEVLLGRENSLFTLEASRGDSFATKVLQRFTLASLWNVPMRIGLLVQRTLRQVCRDNSSNLVRVAMSAVLAGVISAVYGRPGSALSDTNVSAHINIIAQGVINVAMLSLIKTLQLFKSERGVVSRERGAGLYSAAEYLIAKSAVELPVDALVAACFATVLYLLTGPSCSLERFVGLLALLGTVSSALGLAVSALAPSGDIALTVGPAIMVVYLILGSIGPAGVSGTALPTLLLPLRFCSPMKWACEGLCAEEFLATASRDQASSLGGTVWAIVLSKVRALVQCARNRCFGKPQDSISAAVVAQTPGRAVLSKLGIASASYDASCRALWVMLGCHLLAALIGLQLNGTWD